MELEAGADRGSFIGLALHASMRSGMVTQSEFRAMMKEAPNSPNDMAITKTEDTTSGPPHQGQLDLEEPRIRPHAQHHGILLVSLVVRAQRGEDDSHHEGGGEHHVSQRGQRPELIQGLRV